MPRRVLTALGLTAIGLPAIIYGNIFYWALITIFLAIAAWEYVRLYRADDLADAVDGVRGHGARTLFL